jgi:hypothetical protein
VGWTSAATLLKIGGAVLLLAAFLVLEARERHPMMPFSIFRLRTLRGANIVGLLVGMSLFSTSVERLDRAKCVVVYCWDGL